MPEFQSPNRAMTTLRSAEAVLKASAMFVVTALLVVAHVFISSIALAEGEEDRQSPSTCPPNLWGTGLHDYRQRDATDWDRAKFQDMWDAHVARALGRMNAGEYSRSVMADLNYGLARWPNHIPMLQGLVRYDLAGGQRYEYHLTECYFVSARAFAPNDVAVRLVEGYYHWKKGNLSKAKAAYEGALEIDPTSADAHYNLGLVLVELKDYPTARDHAREAYAAGFPLPGLMTKLKQAGYWDPAPGEKPSSDLP